MVVKVSNIPNRLKNPSKEHPYVAGAVDIVDDTLGKPQSQVNQERIEDIAEETQRAQATENLLQGEINALSRQNYVTVDSYSDLPDLGAVDTIYRVSNWDGTQVDATKYAEYAWNNTGIDQGEYVLLDVKTQVGEVFDISLYKAVGGVLATFADLSAALDGGNNVPAGVRQGGMSIKFVQSSDNNYQQYRLKKSDWSSAPWDWESVSINTQQYTTDGSFKVVKGEHQIGDAVPNYQHLEYQGSYAMPHTPCVLLPDVTYVIKKIADDRGINNAPVINAEFKDENGYTITSYGFTTLTNVGDSCEVTVQRKTATVSFYIQGNLGRVQIERKIPFLTEYANAISAINERVNLGFKFLGLANILTNPASTTEKVFYLASMPGTYTNFNNYVNNGGIIMLMYTQQTGWYVERLDNLAQYENSPFENGTPSFGTALDAIRELKIYSSDVDKVKGSFRLRWFWLTSSSFYIQIDQQATAGGSWTQAIALQKNGYTPSKDVERFVISRTEDIYCEVEIDWTKINLGDTIDTQSVYIKKENIVLLPPNNLRFASAANNYEILNAIKFAYIIPANAEEYADSYYISFLSKNGTSGFIQVTNSEGKYVEQSVSDATGVKTYEIARLDYVERMFSSAICVDWDKITNGATFNGKLMVYDRVPLPINTASDGYVIKDTTAKILIVDKNNTGDNIYSTIADACAAVHNSSHQNQYEILVNGGIYNENNIYIPPYTHIHGTTRDSVIVTSKDIDSNLPVFEMHHSSSKLSNMIIDSYTGYCVHIDNRLDRQTCLFENIHFIKSLIKSTNSLIGGGSFKFGTIYIFNGCLFEGRIGDAYPSEVGVHTAQFYGNDNTTLRFNYCKFVNSHIAVGSVGGWGKYNCEINNCQFHKGIKSLEWWLTQTHTDANPFKRYADRFEWNIFGGGNKNFCPNLGVFVHGNVTYQGEGVMIESDAAVSGQSISISGSIVDVLFGIPQYSIGGNVLKANAKGQYLVMDEQIQSTDIVQMWKRLGDCSTTNKTMEVSVNGATTQIVTLTEDYLTSKKSETEIIAQINAQLSGLTFKKYLVSDSYDKLETTEKVWIKCKDNNDVLKYSVVTEDGVSVTQNATEGIYGIALKDTPKNMLIPVWTGDGIYLGLADGNYAVGQNGVLVTTSDPSLVVATATNGYVFIKRT